jgi:hypothetical protein
MPTGTEANQQELRQLPQKQRLPGRGVDTKVAPWKRPCRSWAGLIPLSWRSSKHMQEPWLTMITTSGADSSNSRTCRYGKFGKTEAYELIAHERIRAYKMGAKTLIDLDSVDEYHARCRGSKLEQARSPISAARRPAHHRTGRRGGQTNAALNPCVRPNGPHG